MSAQYMGAWLTFAENADSESLSIRAAVYDPNPEIRYLQHLQLVLQLSMIRQVLNENVKRK